MNSYELKKDILAHWDDEMEDDNFAMPSRAQRSQAFNEEIDIG